MITQLIFNNIIRLAILSIIVYFIYKHSYKSVIPNIIAFAFTFLIYFLDSVFNVKVDLLGSLLYTTILFMAMCLGSTLKFYDKFAWWDIAIHFLSGIAFVSFGIAFSSKVSGLSKLNILIFSAAFSITLHVIWETAEYISDCIFHTDHQRWQKISSSVNHKSEAVVQPAGLVDTMNDTITCMISTTIACLIWQFIL